MENKKMSKRTLRILIGASISLVSLLLGVISGVQVSRSIFKLTNLNNNNNSNNVVYENEFDEIENILRNNWYSEIYYGKEVDVDLLIHQFVGALSTSDDKRLDPYTYLIKNEKVAVSNTGKLGVTISNFFGYPIVVDLSKDGAAEKAGIQVGDLILSLKDVDSNTTNKIVDENIDFNSIFTSTLGQVGEEVEVEYARLDENNKLQINKLTITLDEGVAVPFTSIVKENIDDTLMVKLTGFTSDYKNKNGTYDQFKEILENNTDKNLIIDLRDNGGGDLSSVVDICDLFLPKNTTVCKLEYKNKSTNIYKTKDADEYQFDSIVILQNGNTASASEILISTLQYYFPDKVTLVGTKSYGKGIAQLKVYVMEGRYTLQYTCAKWLRPDDSWIGMTIDSSSEIGFYPETENMILQSDVLSFMRNYTSTLFYDENSSKYDAFMNDKVANENIIFFNAYNMIYNTSIRTDGYFDETCTQALKDYQTLKNIDVTGLMNEETFINFVYDYYLLYCDYNNSFVEKAANIIGA